MLVTIVCLSSLLHRDSTPVATLQSVVDAINKRDWKAMFSHFEGAKTDMILPEFTMLMSSATPMPKVFMKPGTITVSGDNATGTVSLGVAPAGGGEARLNPEDVSLHFSAGDWKIVPSKNKKWGFFASLAEVAVDPSKLKAGKDAAKRTVILSDMKQIALGVLMYTNDYDDKISFDQSTMKAKLNPYLKNDKLWIGPDGKPLDVRINPALLGKKMSSIPEPATTVLLSLGPKGNLTMYDGKTPIGFADGHVKYITKEALSTLKWK